MNNTNNNEIQSFHEFLDEEYGGDPESGKISTQEIQDRLGYMMESKTPTPEDYTEGLQVRYV